MSCFKSWLSPFTKGGGGNHANSSISRKKMIERFNFISFDTKIYSTTFYNFYMWKNHVIVSFIQFARALSASQFEILGLGFTWFGVHNSLKIYEKCTYGQIYLYSNRVPSNVAFARHIALNISCWSWLRNGRRVLIMAVKMVLQWLI